MEKALYPSKYMRITQGILDSYTHKNLIAIDEAGKDSGIDVMYAPFSCIVRRIDLNRANTIWFESSNKILYANGRIDYAVIALSHIDNCDSYFIGQTFKQNQPFYAEGSSGITSGNHVHIECGKGQYYGNGLSLNQYNIDQINNPIRPFDLFFLDRKYHIILNDYNYRWKYLY